MGMVQWRENVYDPQHPIEELHQVLTTYSCDPNPSWVLSRNRHLKNRQLFLLSLKNCFRTTSNLNAYLFSEATAIPEDFLLWRVWGDYLEPMLGTVRKLIYRAA